MKGANQIHEPGSLVYDLGPPCEVEVNHSGQTSQVFGMLDHGRNRVGRQAQSFPMTELVTGNNLQCSRIQIRCPG